MPGLGIEESSHPATLLCAKAVVVSEIDWLSTEQAARILGVTVRTVYKFIDDGALPAYRFGRVIRLQRDELDAFIDSCRIQPGDISKLYPEPQGEGRSIRSRRQMIG